MEAGQLSPQGNLLEVRGLSKSFGGTQALADVDLDVRFGDVHGVLGQNGSGKSTLLKVLAGFHAPDAGSLTFRGESVPLPLEPGRFRELGMAFVHQDLALVPSLTVTENLVASHLAPGGSRRIRWRRERARARELLVRHGLEAVDPAAPVARLTNVQRALVAIVRAVEELREWPGDSPLLVLDEPTAFLPREGVESLFDLVRGLVRDGASVVFVSHDLEEVRELCDRVTVLRDGRAMSTVECRAASEEDLVELILGMRLARREPLRAGDRARDDVRARVRGARGIVLEGVDVDLHAGEVLGVTGLLGSGFEELPRVLFGAAPGAGELELSGERVALERLRPPQAMRLGIAFVPADRQAEAAIGELSVTDNATMATLRSHVHGTRLSRRGMRATTRELGERFAVQPNDPSLPLGALSGGNQQKVVLAKWLQGAPSLLLLDQPTQGVDVGARGQIFESIRAFADEGTAVLCASADAEELATVCDRVIVLARGRPVRELTGDDLAKDRIAEHVLTSLSFTEAIRTEAVA